MKKTYKDKLFIFFLVLFAVVSTILGFVHLQPHSLKTQIIITRLYEVLVSNIGVTAVIAAAGLGFMAYNDRNEEDQREKVRFKIIVACWTAIALIFVLGIGHMTGVDNLSTSLLEIIFFIAEA